MRTRPRPVFWAGRGLNIPGGHLRHILQSFGYRRLQHFYTNAAVVYALMLLLQLLMRFLYRNVVVGFGRCRRHMGVVLLVMMLWITANYISLRHVLNGMHYYLCAVCTYCNEVLLITIATSKNAKITGCSNFTASCNTRNTCN